MDQHFLPIERSKARGSALYAPLPSSQIVAAPGFPAGERHLPDCAQSRGWENCDCPIGGNKAP